MTENIVDVREGQHSDGFNRYPFEEMEEQSLSILVEGEKQSKPANSPMVGELHVFIIWLYIAG